MSPLLWVCVDSFVHSPSSLQATTFPKEPHWALDESERD